jgi:hypothetical protein
MQLSGRCAGLERLRRYSPASPLTNESGERIHRKLERDRVTWTTGPVGVEQRSQRRRGLYLGIESRFRPLGIGRRLVATDGVAIR